jgi:hypothetical protein
MAVKYEIDPAELDVMSQLRAAARAVLKRRGKGLVGDDYVALSLLARRATSKDLQGLLDLFAGRLEAGCKAGNGGALTEARAAQRSSTAA